MFKAEIQAKGEQKLQTWHKTLLKNLLWLIATIAIFFAMQAYQTRNVPQNALEFSGMSTTGELLSLSEFQQTHRREPVLLYFWASWCPICKHTAPNIDAIVPDAAVLTIASQSGAATEVRERLQHERRNWTTIADPDGSIQSKYGFFGVPAFVIIGQDGKIYATSIGYTTEFGLRMRLRWAKWRAKYHAAKNHEPQ